MLQRAALLPLSVSLQVGFINVSSVAPLSSAQLKPPIPVHNACVRLQRFIPVEVAADGSVVLGCSAANER